MTEREIIEGLLEIAEKHEWIFEEGNGGAEKNDCWECGASYKIWQPKLHKPDCRLERLIMCAKFHLGMMELEGR